MIVATTAVSMDEPCLLLKEEHEQAPGSRGWRRYQTLVVMRGDRPATFRTDLGAARRFKDVQQFRIPGGARDEQTGRFHVEHTVGELRDIADLYREGVQRPPEIEPTITPAAIERELSRRAAARRLSRR